MFKNVKAPGRRSKRANIYAVILVGGKGKRLEPISVDTYPKAFLPITKSDETMFKKTLDRIRRFVPPDRIIVVANKHHAKLVKKDFPGIERKNLILEPVARNTAPAIALAASVVEKRSAGAIMLVLPSDHYIIGEDKYIDCLRKGSDFIKSCRLEDPLLVIGIKPHFPATGFGYIKLKGVGRKAAAKDIYEVERFVEKPDLERAKIFVADRHYMWNSGVFIFKASTILKAVEIFAPAVYDAIKRIGAVKIDKLYKEVPNISIDYAVMERSGSIYCVKAGYGWRDMGNLNILREVLEAELKDLKEKEYVGKHAVKKPMSMRILERLHEIIRE